MSTSVDAWMPFYGDDFNNATKMFAPAVKWSYLECLWFYWSHTKCEGLPDDNDMLRRLCDCDAADWMRTKGQIFCGKPFFFLENGRWHQKRARELYLEAVAISQKRSESGSKGAAIRWQKDGNANGPANGEAISEAIGNGVAKSCHPQPQPQSHLQPPAQSQKQGEWSAPRKLSSAELIKHEKELVRVNGELKELGNVNDYAAGSKKAKRIEELRVRQSELRNLLGVKA